MQWFIEEFLFVVVSFFFLFFLVDVKYRLFQQDRTMCVFIVYLLCIYIDGRDEFRGQAEFVFVNPKHFSPGLARYTKVALKLVCSLGVTRFYPLFFKLRGKSPAVARPLEFRIRQFLIRDFFSLGTAAKSTVLTNFLIQCIRQQEKTFHLASTYTTAVRLSFYLAVVNEQNVTYPVMDIF